jgi:large subunit ribosomal protein L6
LNEQRPARDVFGRLATPSTREEDFRPMSRIGRKPVVVPDKVTISVNDLNVVVEGPKGKLEYRHRPEIGVKYDEAAKQVLVTRSDDERLSRALHGLTRSLISNMVQGVTAGYTKKLEIVGVGYQAQLKKANTVALQVGYANQVVLEAPPGVSVVVPDSTHITISGADKQAVGQFAAVVRKVRPPEPYKGKGIRYEGEVVRRKAGKAFGSK